MSAKSLSGAREPIFLSEWISRAVDEVDLSNLVTDGTDPSQWPANIRNTMALCSDEFLLTALRVARSLVDQICEEEEAGRRPIPSSNWADSVVMNYNQVGELHDGRTNSQDGLGFNDSLDSLGFDHRKVVAEEDNFDDFFGESVIKDGTTLPSNEKDRVEDGDFFSTTAKFLSSLFNNCDDDDGLIRDDMQCIYSLGIVFYVIFSGGERFVELDNKKEPPQELSTEDLEPLPFDQDVSIELAGKFSILDDIEKECNPMNDTGDDEVFTSQNPRKRQSQNNNDHEGCYASVESLRVKGLPRSLCDLVANMMGCVNATLSGEDSYRTMSEVRSDLQIMLDEPAIYLYDQDMWRLSTTGLQFGDKVFGRNAELSAIKDAYRRSVSGESELVTISGPSGSGKSILAHEFGKYVFAEGGIVLSGKFDQLQLGKPFSALASAFDKYCGILLHNGELNLTRQEVARQVKSVLGVEAYYLAKMIPNLATILGHEPHPIDNDEDCFNAQKRLQYLLCQFVEIIASSSSATVMLFLDDLQWVDAASIAAVNQLLLTAGNSQNTQFFFLGCYREGDIGNSNPLWKALCNSDLLNARCTDIKLDCMDKNTVNTMVSETLCLSPRLTRTLSSVIHHKTKGNPLFVSQLMISLSKEGLLRPSLIRRRWEWDKEKIQCQQIHDDVAMLLAHSIGKLSEDVKSSLCVLSCFGASSEISFIKILENALGKSLLVGLDIAVAEGLLDKRDDQYRFSHDRIQEAAYNMMNFLDRCHFHFNYGMALAPLAAGEVGDSILLTAVTQLNLAGPEAVEEKSQNAIVANLNLRAGKKAMEMSDFGAAYSYFDNGISFLRKNHWDEHYDLSLELFHSAAKCALTISDFTSLGLIYQEVVTKAHFFEDKLNVTYFTTCALAASPKLPEAIEKGLDVLSKLGIELRGYESSLEVCVQETEDLLSGYTDDEILNTRRMTDPNMIIAMKFLGKLELGMTQMMPKTVPYVTQRIIQLSLSHGMSPVSPIGFVYFGSYIAKLGDISKGYHYVKLALSLLGKVGSREYAGDVICIATQVRTYVEPLQAAMEFHNEGYTAAMASGDISQATINIFCLNWLRFSAGVNLQTVREKYSEAQKMMEKTKQVIFKTHALQSQRCIFKLIGTDEEPNDVSEENDILATTSAVFKAHLYQKAYISFMFRSYDDAKHFAEKFVACAGNVIWANLFFAEAAQAFYTGLISFWVVRKSRGEQQWLERGITSKLALKKWAQASKWTFENKWYLLEAEESFCNNDFEAAKTYYEKAISSAKEHKFVHEEALACELAAYFYLELGERERTVHYFLLAHEKYHEWGAIGKCSSIFKFVESMERFWHGS